MAVKKSAKKKKGPVAADEAYVTAPSGVLRVICYIAAFFFPAAGFTLGAVFYAQKGADNKSFGRICFIIMGISLALIIIAGVFMMFLGMIFSGVGLAQVNVREGYY